MAFDINNLSTWVDDQYTPCVIRSVDAKGVTVYVPAMGQTFILDYSMGTPDEMPKVGDMWLMQRISYTDFILVKKIVLGDVNFIELGCVVNCRLAISRERYIVQTLRGFGITEVWLLIAEQGVVCWSGDWLEESELYATEGSCHQMITLLKEAGIKVYAAISNDLWVGKSKYNQVRLDGTISTKFSFATAKDILSKMVADFIKQYGDLIDGVGFIGCSVDARDSLGDCSATISRRFYRQYGVTSNAVAGEKLLKWVDLQETIYREFVSEMVKASSVPVSMILDRGRLGGVLHPGVRSNMLLDPETTRGGIAISYEQSHSTESEIESLNFGLAALRAIEGTTGIAQIDIDDVDDWDSFFQAVAYQDTTFILFDDFEKLSHMSQMRREEFFRGYSEWAVSQKYTGESSAVVLSDTSSLLYELKDQIAWWGSAELLYQALSRNLGHRIDIVRDESLASYPRSYRAVVYPFVDALSDESIARLTQALIDDGQVCFVIGGEDLFDIFKASQPKLAEVTSAPIPDKIPYSGGNTIVLDEQYAVYQITQTTAEVTPDTFPLAAVRLSYYLPVAISQLPAPLVDSIGMIISAAVNGGEVK